jgi:hypothetical protein
MPQMEFYFNDYDRKELFNFIQLKGGKLIPDIFFSSEEYKLISDYEDFFHYQESETTHFFLIDNNFIIEPLIISKNTFIKEPKYYINQRKGGPYIDFSFYRGHSKDSIIPYKMSVIDIYPKFIHHNNYEEFKATDELKDYYNNIVNYIKGKCEIIIKEKKKYWISTNVLKELKTI